MAKKNIHPVWHKATKVYCNGELIMEVGSTQTELMVDIWSGNHPFFTGSQKVVDTEGRIDRFNRRYNQQAVEEQN